MRQLLHLQLRNHAVAGCRQAGRQAGREGERQAYSCWREVAGAGSLSCCMPIRALQAGSQPSPQPQRYGDCGSVRQQQSSSSSLPDSVGDVWTTTGGLE